MHSAAVMSSRLMRSAPAGVTTMSTDVAKRLKANLDMLQQSVFQTDVLNWPPPRPAPSELLFPSRLAAQKTFSGKATSTTFTADMQILRSRIIWSKTIQGGLLELAWIWNYIKRTLSHEWVWTLYKGSIIVVLQPSYLSGK